MLRDEVCCFLIKHWKFAEGNALNLAFEIALFYLHLFKRCRKHAAARLQK